MNKDILDEIAAVIEARKTASADSSYVASLYAKGLNTILKKIAEEAGETIIAAKDKESGNQKAQIVYETADLWFHSMVMLAHFDLSPTDVLEELQRRFGTSGIVEKAARKGNK